MDLVIAQFDVYRANFDPAIGSEIRKPRPCVVLSRNEMNSALQTVIVAPLTSTDKRWPSRVACRFGGRVGEVALDQMRAMDKQRLHRRLGTIDSATADRVRAALQVIFR